MRIIRLSGREASVVRAIGFAESSLGADIQDATHMEIEDVTETVNSLIAAGFVESMPYYEEVPMAEFSGMAFELNPAYAHQLKTACRQR